MNTRVSTQQVNCCWLWAALAAVLSKQTPVTACHSILSLPGEPAGTRHPRTRVGLNRRYLHLTLWVARGIPANFRHWGMPTVKPRLSRQLMKEGGRKGGFQRKYPKASLESFKEESGFSNRWLNLAQPRKTHLNKQQLPEGKNVCSCSTISCRSCNSSICFMSDSKPSVALLYKELYNRDEIHLPESPSTDISRELSEVLQELNETQETKRQMNCQQSGTRTASVTRQRAPGDTYKQTN